MRINRSPSFVRAFKRYVRKLTVRQAAEVYRSLILFEKDWQAKELEAHKLKNAGDKWAFTVLHDPNRNDRAIFMFIKKEDEILLINIGSHDVVYGKL